jgi:beta-lactamase class D
MRLSLWFGWLLVAGFVRAAEVKEVPEWGRFFESASATGTIIVCDVSSGELTGFDAARASQRFIPASTFKIPNTLVGLECGAVASVDEILPYGGKPQPFPQWERDMPLREALRISAVPIYQELARRVGLERMREWVKKLDYGNNEIGDVADRFWLDGPLKISAIEQAGFLARLVGGKLPVDAAAVRVVSDITTLERTPEYTLHGKTGWGTATKPGIGWWVGWVERGNRVYTFALNLDAPEDFDMKKRIEIGKACLREAGILPRESAAKGAK